MDKYRHIALQFNNRGNAKVAGIFNDFREDMVVQMNRFAIVQRAKLHGPDPLAINPIVKILFSISLLAEEALESIKNSHTLKSII